MHARMYTYNRKPYHIILIWVSWLLNKLENNPTAMTHRSTAYLANSNIIIHIA